MTGACTHICCESVNGALKILIAGHLSYGQVVLEVQRSVVILLLAWEILLIFFIFSFMIYFYVYNIELSHWQVVIEVKLSVIILLLSLLLLLIVC